VSQVGEELGLFGCLTSRLAWKSNHMYSCVTNSGTPERSRHHRTLKMLRKHTQQDEHHLDRPEPFLYSWFDANGLMLQVVDQMIWFHVSMNMPRLQFVIYRLSLCSHLKCNGCVPIMKATVSKLAYRRKNLVQQLLRTSLPCCNSAC